MASDLEAWWTHNFTKFSIRDLQRLPVYHRFLQLHYPYEREDQCRRERFTVSEEEDVFEWSEGPRMERFTHNKKSQQYHYEVTYPEKTCIMTVHSWTQGIEDWGSISKKFPQWELREGWRITPPARFYERFTVEQGITKGIRCGVEPKDGAEERWVEETWTQEGEDVFKKTWEKAGMSGGENRMRKLEYTWGTEWYSDDCRFERKCWNEEKTRKWGYSNGREGRDQHWEHSWDLTPSSKFEERISYKCDRALGYRYRQQASDWYKQEWEGHLAIPGDAPWDDTISSKAAARTERLYMKEYAGAVQSERTLRMMLAGAPQYAKQVAGLEETLGKVHAMERRDLMETLTRIEELRDVQDQQEALKQTMRESESSDLKQMSQFISSLRDEAMNSLETLKSLTQIIQTDKLDQEIMTKRTEIDRATAATDASCTVQVDSWKAVLSSLETLKRDSLRSLRKIDSKDDPKSAHAQTLRRQHLEDALKAVYEQLGSTHAFVRDFSEIIGDDRATASNDALKREYEAVFADAQIAKNPEQLMALLATLRAFAPIQQQLLDSLRQGQGGRAGQHAEELNRMNKEILPQVQEMADELMKMANVEEVSDEDSLSEDSDVSSVEGSYQAAAMSLGQGVTSVKHGLWVIRGLMRKVVQHAGNSGKAAKILESLLQDTHLLAEDLTNFNPPTKGQLQTLKQEVLDTLPELPQESDMSEVLSGLKAYVAFMKKIVKEMTSGETPDPIVKEAMRMLEPAQKELNDLAISIGAPLQEYESQLKNLQTEAENCFSDYRKSHNGIYLFRGIAAVQTYFPLMRDMLRKAQACETPSTPSDQDTSDARDAMEELQYALAELTDIAVDMTEGDTELQGKVRTLESQNVKPIEGDQITTSDLVKSIRSLRAFHPIIREIGRKSGVRAALEALEAALVDTHKDAEEKTGMDPEAASDLQQLQLLALTFFKEVRLWPSKEQLSQGLKVLRAYLPYFLHLSGRKAMKIIESLASETHELAQELTEASESKPEGKLASLHQTVCSQLAEYRRSPSPAHVIQTLQGVEAYIPFMQGLVRKLTSGETMHPAIVEAIGLMETLQGELAEVAKDMSQNDPSQEPRLKLIADEASGGVSEFKKNPSAVALPKIVAAIRGYTPILQELSQSRSKPASSSTEDPSLVYELLQAFAPVFIEINILAYELAEGETDHQSKLDQLRDESTGHLSSPPTKATMLRAIGSLRAYHPILRQLAGRAGLGRGMKLLEPALDDTHREADDIASEHADLRGDVQRLRNDVETIFKEYRQMPKREHLQRAVNAMRAYYPFFRGSSWKPAMKLVKPMIEEMHQLASDMAEIDAESNERLPGLYREATAPFQASRLEASHLPTALKGLKAYIPFIRALGKGMLSGEHPHPIFAEAMRLLSTSPRDLSELATQISNSDPTHRSRLRALEDSAAAPFREYKKAPQYQYLIKAIGALQAYYPVLKEMAKSARPKTKIPAVKEAEHVADTLLVEVMEELKTTSTELRELVQSISDGDPSHEVKLQSISRDVSKPFKDSRRVPRGETILQAIRLLRTYHPLILELSRRAGLKAIMDIMESTLADTHREAVNHAFQDTAADEELEKLHKDASAPIKEFKTAPKQDHLRQAVAALRAYHPFFRNYSWKHAMRLLEPILCDTHELAKDLSDTEGRKDQLANMRRDTKTAFKEFKTTPKSAHLPQIFGIFKAYLVFIKELVGAKGGIPLAAIEAVMKALEAYPSELEEIAKAMLDDEQCVHPRLTVLRGDSTAPFRDFKSNPDVSHLPRAIQAIRGYLPLLRDLLKKLKDRHAANVSNSLEEVMRTLEPTSKELSDLAKDMAEDDPSRDDTLREMRENAEAAFREHRAEPSENTAVKAVKALRAYPPVLQSWLHHTGFRSIMGLLEPILQEFHRDAVDLSANDLTLALELHELEAASTAPFKEYRIAPKRGQVQQALSALSAYGPFFRMFSWRYALKHLEPVIDQAHEFAEELAEENDDFLLMLRREATSPFAEHRKTPKLGHLMKVSKALGSYLTFIRSLVNEKQPVEMPMGRPSLGGGPPHFSVTEAMTLLEPAYTDLEELISTLSDNDPDYQPSLATLHQDAAAPFEEYKRSPQNLLLPRAISAVRAYHPLLKELIKARRSDREIDTIVEQAMQELEPAALGLNELAIDMTEGEPTHEGDVTAMRDQAETPFRNHRREPKKEDLITAIRAVKAYQPLLRELLGYLGIRATMAILEPILTETHKEAVDLASGDDLEYSAELHQLERAAVTVFREYKKHPKRVHFPQALSALRAYHPFFRRYWWRRGMKLLESTIPEFDRILIKRFPRLESKAIPLRQKVAAAFKNYRNGFRPSHLPFAVEILQTYHRLLEERKEEAKEAESPRAVRIVVTEPDEPTEPAFMLEASAANVQQADDFINREKRDSIVNNVIIHSLQRANIAAEKPLTYLNIFRFFEEIMDKKLEVDTQDLKAQRKPRGMTEFLMEHLNRQFGIKPLALKFLGQLIPGLQILYNENNQYAILFSRLLQVFHPDPVPFPLAMFLTRVRVEFHKLAEKCTRERELRDKKIAKTKKADVTHGRAAYDYAITGGEAFTAEVIMLIYDLFENDTRSGELALKLLKPDGVSMANYVIFKLCHKMAKMGLSPDAVFNLIDADGGGSIDADEFVIGIKTSLELWISESDIREVYDEIAEYGELSRAVFSARCNFDWYLSVVKSDEFVTTKCHFLNVLIDVYNKRQRDDMAKLIAMYETAGEDPMLKATFVDLVKSVDASNSDERIEVIWKCGKEEDLGSPGLSQLAFAKCMLRYPSGPFADSKFCKR